MKIVHMGHVIDIRISTAMDVGIVGDRLARAHLKGEENIEVKHLVEVYLFQLYHHGMSEILKPLGQSKRPNSVKAEIALELYNIIDLPDIAHVAKDQGLTGTLAKYNDDLDTFIANLLPDISPGIRKHIR